MAERLAAAEWADPARIVELREEFRERGARQRWRAQQARRSGRQLYGDEQIARALALVAEGKTYREAGAAVDAAAEPRPSSVAPQTGDDPPHTPGRRHDDPPAASLPAGSPTMPRPPRPAREVTPRTSHEDVMARARELRQRQRDALAVGDEPRD